MAQEANVSFKTLMLARFEFETSCCQLLKFPTQMSDMFLGHTEKDNDIVQVKDTPAEMQISWTGLYEMLKGGRIMCKAKRHTYTFRESQGSHDKGGEWFTSFL